MNSTRCTGTTKRGRPCRSFVYKTDLCRVHWVQAYGDPAEQDALRAQQVEAGKRSSNVARAQRELSLHDQMTVEDALRILSAASLKVYAGDMAPGVGTALASMIGALVRVHHEEHVETALDELERYARIR